MKTILALGACLVVLAACDLEEARRMDLTQGEVRAIQPEFGGVLFRGREEIPLSALDTLVAGWSPSNDWSLVWTDSGTDLRSFAWTLEGRLDGETVLKVSTGQSAWFYVEWPRPFESWKERASEVEFVLVRLPEEIRIPVPRLKIVDDRPNLVSRCDRDSGTTVHRGDTLTISFQNPGPDTLEVYSDYAGARSIGDYLRKLATGQSGEFRWVVTAGKGENVTIDLGWGDPARTRHFEFFVE